MRTAADALTAIAAATGATVGGFWTYRRYRLQEPDVPRVNTTVGATLFDRLGVDYLAIEICLQHIAGGTLKIIYDGDFDDPPRPIIEIIRLTASDKRVRRLDGNRLLRVDVLDNQTELASSEFTKDHMVVCLGSPSPDTIGYDVTLRFAAGWADDVWTWSTNAVVRCDGTSTATGATIVGARAT